MMGEVQEKSERVAKRFPKWETEKAEAAGKEKLSALSRRECY
jgi:hypothetical protein